MRRPPWGGLSTFEWSEDSGRLQSGPQWRHMPRSRHTEKLTAETFLEQQLESRWMAKLED